VRYERQRAGELLHIDTEKLGRFNQVGHRITGLQEGRKRSRAGFDIVHVAIDDATRLAYVEVLADDTGASAALFLERAIAWYRAHKIAVERVMTDNGPAYLSNAFHAALARAGAKHPRTKPYTPKTNGKAERFIQTCSGNGPTPEPYCSSSRRNAALPAFLARYNRKRPHASLAGRPPFEALQLKR
jgi:transposase InsO family protein